MHSISSILRTVVFHRNQPRRRRCDVRRVEGADASDLRFHHTRIYCCCHCGGLQRRIELRVLSAASHLLSVDQQQSSSLHITYVRIRKVWVFLLHALVHHRQCHRHRAGFVPHHRAVPDIDGVRHYIPSACVRFINKLAGMQPRGWRSRYRCIFRLVNQNTDDSNGSASRILHRRHPGPALLQKRKF